MNALRKKKMVLELTVVLEPSLLFFFISPFIYKYILCVYVSIYSIRLVGFFPILVCVHIWLLFSFLVFVAFILLTLERFFRLEHTHLQPNCEQKCVFIVRCFYYIKQKKKKDGGEGKRERRRTRKNVCLMYFIFAWWKPFSIWKILTCFIATQKNKCSKHKKIIHKNASKRAHWHTYRNACEIYTYTKCRWEKERNRERKESENDERLGKKQAKWGHCGIKYHFDQYKLSNLFVLIWHPFNQCIIFVRFRAFTIRDFFPSLAFPSHTSTHKHAYRYPLSIK